MLQMSIQQCWDQWYKLQIKKVIFSAHSIKEINSITHYRNKLIVQSVPTEGKEPTVKL